MTNWILSALELSLVAGSAAVLIWYWKKVGRIQRATLIAVLLMNIFLAGMNLGGGAGAIGLLIINARGGCYPWSPSEVEFHQGMTICPGQTATMHMDVITTSPDPRNEGI